jgi:hypothetical protein
MSAPNTYTPQGDGGFQNVRDLKRFHWIYAYYSQRLRSELHLHVLETLRQALLIAHKSTIESLQRLNVVSGQRSATIV